MWKEAEEDCTDVLDIAEFFEKGFEKSKDSYFKAFQRRAKARQGLGRREAEIDAVKAAQDYEKALQDVDEALKLDSSNKEVINFKKQLEKDREARIICVGTKFCDKCQSEATHSRFNGNKIVMACDLHTNYYYCCDKCQLDATSSSSDGIKTV